MDLQETGCENGDWTHLAQDRVQWDLQNPILRTAVYIVVFRVLHPKEFGHNSYATKKTITQGLLDIALLTANASQLKIVLEVGEAHPYYVLLITLLSVSIALQVARKHLVQVSPLGASHHNLIRATCPANITLLHFITLIKLGD
jgi:hypothetical protein